MKQCLHHVLDLDRLPPDHLILLCDQLFQFFVLCLHFFLCHTLLLSVFSYLIIAETG